MIETAVRPRGPYSFRLSTALAADATRSFADGVMTAVLPAGGRTELGRAWQQPDGMMVLRAESEAGLDLLRFVLALDADHSAFLRRFAADPLLGRATRELRGLRPARLTTVAHALLRAFCGQLITSSGARALERSVLRAVTPAVGRLHVPPACADLGSLAPAELRAVGLHARRGAALVRICRSLDLEQLRLVPTASVLERLLRERGVGPWSVGVVCLQGLGRFDHGLVGDLGLIKLAAALHGRRAEADETAALLAPYGEWAGLASVYLLAAWGRGLLPVRQLESFDGRWAKGGDPRHRQDRRVAPRRPPERGLATT